MRLNHIGIRQDLKHHADRRRRRGRSALRLPSASAAVTPAAATSWLDAPSSSPQYAVYHKRHAYVCGRLRQAQDAPPSAASHYGQCDVRRRRRRHDGRRLPHRGHGAAYHFAGENAAAGEARTHATPATSGEHPPATAGARSTPASSPPGCSNGRACELTPGRRSPEEMNTASATVVTYGLPSGRGGSM